MLRYALALFIIQLSFGVAAHDYSTPEQAVNTYIKAVKTGSGEHIKMAFIKGASIRYYNPEGEFKDYQRDEFASLVNTGNKWDATIVITEMKTTGYAANATVDFTWGENGENGYTDYLNLIYDGKSWHISDKVAQFVVRK